MLPSEEVEHIAERAGLCAIDFGETTARARHGGKLFVLNIKEFRHPAASGCELTGIKFVVAALEACPMLVSHSIHSVFLSCVWATLHRVGSNGCQRTRFRRIYLRIRPDWHCIAKRRAGKAKNIARPRRFGRMDVL